MNKSAIKTYAVWARTELIKLVTQRAYEYEVTADNTPAYNTDSVHGRPLENEEKKQLNELIDEVNKHGFEHVIEEVAYTWFNSFIALRYMEVNNYLPQKVRVFTNENNEFKPELLTDAIHIELDGLDKQKVFDFIEHNNQEDLYKYLLLTLCNDMNQYLPDMFASISDYKSLLMPNNLLREDSIIGKMITDIDEDSWNDQVQIIGWLYQYYNSELKDIVMKKKNYTKDDIPAATQLFTPDWIVRYMTENSLGRLWLDGHPDFDHSNWKYYLEEAEQEPQVLEQLKKIREEHAKLKPEDIKVIDPCMGSGHILVYSFDVLMDIYRDSGYTDRNAAKSILENNIYGLEIDERAYHLAYFALMMKARSYNRRILSKDTKINILEIREPMGKLKEEYDHYLGDYTELSHYLVNEFAEAKELGSIINLSCTLEQLEGLEGYLNSLKSSSMNQDIISDTEIEEIIELLSPLVRQAKLLVQKYDVVITNPPYMGNYPKNILRYALEYYPYAKYDIYSLLFIRFLESSLKQDGMISFVTGDSWMFIDSFTDYRKYLMTNYDLSTMLYLGDKAFDDGFGTVAYIFNKSLIHNSKGAYYDVSFISGNEENYYEIIKNNSKKFIRKNTLFLEHEKAIISFKLPVLCFEYLLGDTIKDYSIAKAGVVSGKDSYFVRVWYEINYADISFDAKQLGNYGKYHLFKNGGGNNQYFGNNYYVIKLSDLYNKKYYNKSIRRGDSNFYFKKCITWSKVGNKYRRFTISDKSVCGSASPAIYVNNEDYYYILGFLNSLVAKIIIDSLNPTMNLQSTDVAKLPLILDYQLKKDVLKMTQSNVKITKQDWDSFEVSWDFKRHPLVNGNYKLDLDAKLSNQWIEASYNEWKQKCDDCFNKLKANEEKLNRIFIDIYGLQDDLDCYVDDKDITIRKADLVRDIKSFISYAVGCMFGRYSLDIEGIAYAGGEWDDKKYKTFIPDEDDIIPVCDEEYFEDDIVSRFIEFVRCIYGEETLEENLQFISNALGGNGNSREVLRNYFLKEFFKDHCNIYQVTGSGKKPIYWQFDSGKKNGFKALVYIHRYTPDLIAKMRTGYIHPLQSQYRTQIEMLNNQIDEASLTSEKVKLKKQLKKIAEQAEELGKYEEKIHHWADKMEPMDLDDGVKVNYAKFQELLAKIK